MIKPAVFGTKTCGAPHDDDNDGDADDNGSPAYSQQSKSHHGRILTDGNMLGNHDTFDDDGSDDPRHL